MRLQGSIINFLGDSITAGAGATSVQNRYTDVLDKEFSLKKANNYSISGSRIARQQHMTDAPKDRDYCMRVEEMDLSADGVVVFGGTNDYGHGDAPLGTPDDRSPETFYGACHTLMDRLITLYCGKPVLIVTPLRRLNENNPRGGVPEMKKLSVAPLVVYRNILIEVAEQYALPVLDLYTVSGIIPENPVCLERLIPDGLHPSDEGHRILARKIGSALLQL